MTNVFSAGSGLSAMAEVARRIQSLENCRDEAMTELLKADAALVEAQEEYDDLRKQTLAYSPLDTGYQSRNNETVSIVDGRITVVKTDG